MRSKSSKKSRRRKKPDPMGSLPDDIVVDILSRLPVKCLCRCKGVSRRWRNLISHKDYIRKFPQTLPCVFYSSFDSSRCPKEARHFTNVWEGPERQVVCPSLSFMPGYEIMRIVDCCNGELLCRFSLDGAFRYVVCNPAEKRMAFLPDSGCGAHRRVARLAVGRVFEFVYDDDDEDADSIVVGVNINSADTGTWSYKEGGWLDDPYLFDYDVRSVYFHGCLCIVADSCEVLVVDVEGDLWFTIPLPLPKDIDHDSSVPGFIGIYKEQLCYISELEDSELSIWILEDFRKGDWVVKHKVSLEVLCGEQMSRYNITDCYVVGILQDCNFILYVTGRTLMAYDVDREEVHAIQNLDKGCIPPYFLYVPSYIE